MLSPLIDGLLNVIRATASTPSNRHGCRCAAGSQVESAGAATLGTRDCAGLQRSSLIRMPQQGL
ncbi:hypothetical protein E2R33_08105 [Rathayibacter toxicus]|nr:hypothetical protein E2R33_08105 [Rathayibacter toxicus]